MSTEFFNDQWRIPSNENQNKISNYSMEFDGTSSEIDLGTSVILNSSSAFSFSSWVNLENYTNYAYPYIVKLKTSATNGWRIMLSENSGYEGITIGNSGTFAQVRTSGDISQDFLNSWNHIAVTYNGSGSNTISNWKIYVNGSSVSLITSGVIGSDTNTSFIGSGDGQRFFIGKIDQTTIFDYALSQDQVTQLGAEGYAFNFIPNDKINVGNNSNLNITGALTVSIWMKTTSTAIQGLISKVGSATTRSFGLYIYYSNGISVVQSYVSTDGSAIALTGKGLNAASSVHDGNWHHILMVNDPTTTNNYLYVDGVEVKTTTNGRPLFSSTVDTNIGFLDPSYRFDGELSNAQIFNSVIPPTGSNSVQTIYNNGKPLSDMSGFTSLQGWWKLDDTATFNSGTSVWSIPDASTNSNTGASVGMDASSLVASNIDGELISSPMALNPKPIAYYQLGDQSVDNGANYLVPNNSLSDFVFDWFGGVNGTLIQVPSTSNFAFGSSGFGVSLWINFNSVSVAKNILDFRTNGAAAAVGSLWFDPTSGVRWYVAPGYKSANIPASSFSINTWYNIVVVNNGSTIYFYLNGNLVDSATDTTVYIAAPLTIGAYSGGSQPALSGKLSNISIFNTALLTADIQTIYNNGSPNDISSLSPVAWYKLNASEIFNNTSTEWSVDNNAYPSVYKSSLYFDGTNYIELRNSSSTDTSLNLTPDASVSAWIYKTNANAYAAVYSNSRGSTGYYGFSLHVTNLNKLQLRCNLTNNIKLSSASIPLNEWVHIAATYKSGSSNEIKFSINGVVETVTGYSTPLNYSNPSVSSAVRIGEGLGSQAFVGEISNVSIFNTALTTANIETLYNNGTPEASISHSPVSWWKLDNTTTGVQDSAGSNNGTNNGATKYAGFVNALAGESSGMDSSNLVTSDLQQTSGYSPYALSLDGTDDFLDLGTTTAYDTGDLSTAIWVNASSSRTGTVYAFSNSGSPSFAGFDFVINTSNQIRIRRSTMTKSNETSFLTTGFASDTWQHLAFTYNESTNTIKVFLNAVLQDTSIGVTQTNTASKKLTIGSYKGTGNFFNGELSNAVIWNTELTSTQIVEIYNQGRPSDLHNFSGTAPVAWWQLGSNSSFNTNWTCLDEIGTNNAVSANMTNDDITDGPGYSASGLGSSTIDIKGDAPYSTANGLSENMDVLDRVSGTGNVPS